MEVDLFIGDNKIVITPSTLRAHNIIKVPQVVYQCMYDIAQIQGATEASKWQVMKVLEEWVEETYPDYRMVASIELSAKEAQEAQRRYPGIGWGIYVKIAPLQTRLSNNGPDSHLLTP